MNYELAKQLKNAGFPQENREKYLTKCCSHGEWGIIYSKWHDSSTGEWGNGHELKDQDSYAAPTLEELIEAIEPYGIKLEKRHENRTPEGYLKFSRWYADCSDADDYWFGEGDTPEIAIANLWLNIQDPNKRAKTAIQGIHFRGFK